MAPSGSCMAFPACRGRETARVVEHVTRRVDARCRHFGAFQNCGISTSVLRRYPVVDLAAWISLRRAHRGRRYRRRAGIVGQILRPMALMEAFEDRVAIGADLDMLPSLLWMLDGVMPGVMLPVRSRAKPNLVRLAGTGLSIIANTASYGATSTTRPLPPLTSRCRSAIWAPIRPQGGHPVADQCRDERAGGRSGNPVT